MGPHRQPVIPTFIPTTRRKPPDASGRCRTKGLLRRYGLTPPGPCRTPGRELHDLRRDLRDPAAGHQPGDLGPAGGVDQTEGSAAIAGRSSSSRLHPLLVASAAIREICLTGAHLPPSSTEPATAEPTYHPSRWGIRRSGGFRSVNLRRFALPRRSDETAKAFVLGVYPRDALHVRWKLPMWAQPDVGRSVVGAPHGCRRTDCVLERRQRHRARAAVSRRLAFVEGDRPGEYGHVSRWQRHVGHVGRSVCLDAAANCAGVHLVQRLRRWLLRQGRRHAAGRRHVVDVRPLRAAPR